MLLFNAYDFFGLFLIYLWDSLAAAEYFEGYRYFSGTNTTIVGKGPIYAKAEVL